MRRGLAPVGTQGALRWVGFRPGRSEQCPPTTRPGWERRAVKRVVPGVQQQERSTPVAERCPPSEGPTSNPDRRTGPRTKELNTPPLRPALPAESNLKSAPAAFPRGRPQGERINPQGKARATGTVPPKISMAGNLGKARQHSYYQPPRHRMDSPCEGKRPNRSLRLMAA